ncbi:MAG: hypothetical protein WA477_01280 [Candidatus Sulfotelmatobacter sp.]
MGAFLKVIYVESSPNVPPGDIVHKLRQKRPTPNWMISGDCDVSTLLVASSAALIVRVL